jgi:signal transduction histidine kinase/ligand-binding sensor domain-containing protein
MTLLNFRYCRLIGQAAGFLAALLFLLSLGQGTAAQARSSILSAAPETILHNSLAQSTQSPLPPDLRFEHLTTDDGLSHSSVFFINQDQQGFLWAGTQDGLNRYDGYRFTVFRSDPNDTSSLSHNAVLCMEEDPDGFLWFGTWGGGLNRFDPRSGIFTRYLHNPSDPESLSSNTVSALFLDAQDRLWVGTIGGGLNLMDRQTGRFTRYKAASGQPDGLSSDNISAIIADSGGRLWIGTGGLGVEGSGLDRFDPQTGEVHRYRFRPNDPLTLSSNTISSLVFDAQGFLWVGTGGYTLQGRGLNRLDPRTGQVARYQHDASSPTSLNSNIIMSLHLDASQTLWIGTWGGGLDRLDTTSDNLHFIHYMLDPYDPYSLSANTIWSIFQDRSGVLWFGSAFGGLNKVNPLMQRFHLYRNNPGMPRSLAGNAVGPIIEGQDGFLWVGTLGFGLDRFERERAVFTHYTVRPENPQHQMANTYQALLEDQQGNLWTGSMLGLAQFDRKTGQFTYYYHDPANPESLSGNMITALAEDSNGRLWVANQNGLDWFDQENRRFVHMEIPETGPGTDLLIDNMGRLWFGTQTNGLFRLDLSTVSGSSVKYAHYRHNPRDQLSLGNDSIVDIYSGSDGTLWIATGRGLDHLDYRMRQFTHFREEDGLASNSVLCVLEDSQKRIWVSTNNGISRFDRSKAQFRTIDALDGLQGNEFNPRSCLRANSGEMYFGGFNGLSVFDPQNIQDNEFPPLVAVTNFRIYNEPVAADFSGNTPIHLTYKQEFITFEFVALDFHIPQKNRLAYLLDGFDKDWVKADIGRYASYTNLPGGEYVFRVRGANNDGVWSEQEVAIPLIVDSPVWELLWFRAGAILLFGLVVVLSVRAYLDNIRNQNRRLEKLVEQRTTVLRQTNQRLQQEISQREKVEAALAHKAAEEAVAEERSRLARDLHDAVTQTLFSASLTAEVLPDLWEVDRAEAKRSTEDLRQLTRGALAEMRTLLLELRPSALCQARCEDLLRQLAEAVIGRTRLPVELTVTGQRSLTPEVQVVLYRIAQESLNNIIKYSKATMVCIDLQMSPAGVLLSIRDNGIGFNPESLQPTSLGLRIMRERAESIGADLAVVSAPGKGTMVEVSWNEVKMEETA